MFVRSCITALCPFSNPRFWASHFHKVTSVWIAAYRASMIKNIDTRIFWHGLKNLNCRHLLPEPQHVKSWALCDIVSCLVCSTSPHHFIFLLIQVAWTLKKNNWCLPYIFDGFIPLQCTLSLQNVMVPVWNALASHLFDNCPRETSWRGIFMTCSCCQPIFSWIRHTAWLIFEGLGCRDNNIHVNVTLQQQN